MWQNGFIKVSLIATPNVLKVDETGAYLKAHLDHVPAFLKWAMGMPDSYTMKI